MPDRKDIIGERARPAGPHRIGVKRISLALQGGGSHGAFTWGVLHRLMADPRLYIDGISGTSAGAVNAVVMVDGFVKAKRQGAIDAMEAFWLAVADQGGVPRLWPRWASGGNPWKVDHDPGFVWFDYVSRLTSPYEFNPMGFNPLGDILVRMVDFPGLRARKEVKLFVSASNVRTCKPRVFRTGEISVDAVLASACLPLLFKAVEIDGEHYWDGGYLGNPAIYPLIHECASSDVMIVQINPMNRPEVPTTARDILNRINEMSFNASLVREMRGVATVTRLSEAGQLGDERYDTVRFHAINAEAELAAMGALSKMNTESDFLRHLHELGFNAADLWLEQNFERIGISSTLDLLETYT